MKDACTVLVVDDDDGCRDLLDDFLGVLGYRVEVARDGREALDRLHAAERRPRLILLDLMMPGMSGLEFRREQARDPNLADIPVVLMSATVRDTRPEAGSAKVDVCIKKPFNLSELAAIVKRHCVESAVQPAAAGGN
jgi:CheY-like chemotaxis protein